MNEHEINIIIIALRDYINKCYFLKSKTSFYFDLWEINIETTNNILKELAQWTPNNSRKNLFSIPETSTGHLKKFSPSAKNCEHCEARLNTGERNKMN